MRRPLAVLAVATAAAGFWHPVLAEPFFQVTTTAGVSSQGTQPVTTSGQFNDPNPLLTRRTEGSAIAGEGFVGATAQTVTQTTGSSGSISTVHFSSARMIITDLLFSGPDVDPIPVSLNLSLAGSILSDADWISPTFSGSLVEARSSVNFSVLIRNASGFPIYSDSGSVDILNRETDQSSLAGPNVRRVSATGLFGDFTSNSATGYSINSVGSTVSFMLDDNFINEELVLEMFLTVSAGTLMEDATGMANVTAQFGNTISFATQGPVFGLPDGFDVSSAQGNIVHNRFSLPGASAPVSEPGMLPLLALAFGALALSRRKARGLA